ncbi:MAG: hypothetical protein GVY20_01550 [Bacteroidetes bacterium]|jgi:hypothetical protein|nr:hypothetical protein [Bacteroidota bacterium]
MSKVFIVGAGFSKGLAKAPITNELFGIIVKEAKAIEDGNGDEGWKDSAKNLLSLLNNYNEQVSKTAKAAKISEEKLVTVEGFYPINMEYLCTVLELNANYAFNADSKKSSLDFPIPFLNGLTEKQINRIVEFIKTHIFINLLPDKLTPKIELLDKFTNLFSAGDVVITFNYDLVLDQTLWRNNLWNPIDGYSFSKPVFDPVILDDYKDSKIKLLKPHGSINWKIEPRNRLRKEVTVLLNYQTKKEGFFDGLKVEPTKVVKDKENYYYSPAILPTFIKMYSSHWFSDIIDESIRKIQTADEIFLLGYSLPDPDTLGQILISSISNKAKITIVNSDSTNKLKVSLVNNFGIQNKNINFNQQRIEEWITRVN